MIFAGGIGETKATRLLGGEDIVGCGTGRKVADSSDSFNQLGSVRLEGFSSRVG